MGAAVYVGKRPAIRIDGAGLVHLSYGSGDERYERTTPIQEYEEHLAESARIVSAWREAHPDHNPASGLRFVVDAPPAVELAGDDALLTLRSGDRAMQVAIPIPLYRHAQDDGDGVIASYDAGTQGT